MEAAGYLPFSGISGLGDLGTGGDGVLFGASPHGFGEGYSCSPATSLIAQ